MNKENNQKKSNPSFFSELGEYMKPYKNKFMLSIIISILAVICEVSTYILAGKLIGALIDGDTFNQCLYWVITIAICKFLNIIFINLSTWISHHGAYATLKDIRNALVDKMMKLPIGYFEENGVGRLKAILVDRVESIEITLAHFLPEMTANLLVPMILLVGMVMVEWRIAICVIIWIVLGMSASMGMMKGYEEKFSGQIQVFKTMNQVIVEYISGIDVIKMFNQTNKSYQKYEEAIYAQAKYSIDWTKETSIFTALMNAIAPYSIFPLILSGIFLWHKGVLDTSTLCFLMIITLGIYGPISRALAYFDELAKMGTIAKEIREVLETKELIRVQNSSSKIENYDIEYRNITFKYPKQQENAVENISMKVQQGSMLALVGPSGGGKSTIAKLLAGYFDTLSGEITIGQKKLSNYSQEEINQLISYVDQDTYLFDMSIMDNIRIAKKDASDDEVIAAAKKAGCHEFISKLPNGYDTHAGVAGTKLSGGQRQRIAIVRALLKDAPILILDEATASADPKNQVAIQKALSLVTKNKTLIVVAHRLSTITAASQIAFVKNGKIEDIGTHQKLLKNCQNYQALWNLSTGGIENDFILDNDLETM